MASSGIGFERAICSLVVTAAVLLSGSVGAQQVAALRQAGVTRLSVGVQSLNDDRLAVLGRAHNAQEALQSCFDFRRRDTERADEVQLGDRAPVDRRKNCVVWPRQSLVLSPSSFVLVHAILRWALSQW